MKKDLTKLSQSAGRFFGTGAKIVGEEGSKLAKQGVDHTVNFTKEQGPILAEKAKAFAAEAPGHATNLYHEKVVPFAESSMSKTNDMYK